MVGRDPLQTSFFKGILDGIADSIEAMDTGDYRYASEERWQRSRSAAGRFQLSFWVTLDAVPVWAGDCVVYTGRVVSTHRYHAEADALSQARMNAALFHLGEVLEVWNDGIRSRSTTTGINVAAIDAQWLSAEHDFTLRINRRT